METSNILVTGGAGFIGSHICDKLVEKGYSNVYCIDDLSGGELENIKNREDIEFIQLDLSDSEKTKDIIQDIKPEIIFHLAANAREGASLFQPLNIVRRNYLAYINVLEPAIANGLDKMILFSSMAVYGDQQAPFDENMARDPVDIYGINKSSMEHTTEILSEIHDFRYTILRPHNVFGPKQSMMDKYRNVVMIMINKILRNEPIIIYGDGNQIRSFSYISDSLPCYIRCMSDNKTDGEIINIGGKIPITVNNLADLVCKAMEVDNYPLEYVSYRCGEVPVAYCTTEKSEILLQYKENVGYEEGIEKTAEWARQIGPKEWTEERLILWNNKAPIWWNSC